MRRCSGFTLVELAVTVALCLFLLSLGMPAYSNWKAKYDVEGEIRKLHSDLQFARMKAYSEKASYGVWWGNTNPFGTYRVRKDSNNDGTLDQDLFAVTLKYALTSKEGALTSITFDDRGFCETLGSFYIVSGKDTAIDCLKVSRTRIIPAKWNGKTGNEAQCAAK
jgi:Tfp pilus assembly protein FimT